MPVEKIAITDREQWLSLRRKDVTASAISALFGASEYITPLQLFLQKTGAIEEDSDEPIIDGNEISLSPMGRGTLLEDKAADMLRLLKPTWTVEKCRYYYRDADLRIGATPDLLVNDPERGPGIVQVKNPEASVYRQKWKQDDGTIEPPIDYVVQTIQEAYLTEARWAAIGAFVVSHRTIFRLIDVPIHAGIFDRIKVEVSEFWRRVERNEPYSPDYARDGALLAKLYPQDNGSQIDLRGDNEAPLFVDQLETARAAKKAAEAAEKNAKAAITAKMGEASIALLADGRRVSRKTTNRPAHEVPANSYPVIRILKGRG